MSPEEITNIARARRARAQAEELERATHAQRVARLLVSQAENPDQSRVGSVAPTEDGEEHVIEAQVEAARQPYQKRVADDQEASAQSVTKNTLDISQSHISGLG